MTKVVKKTTKTVTKPSKKDAVAPSSSSSSNSAADNKPSKKVVIKAEDLDPHARKILKIRELMKLRDDARSNGDFTKSDSLRHHLVAKYNIEILDQKNGPSGWKFTDGSSNKIKPGTHLPEQTQSESAPAKKKDSTVRESEKPAKQSQNTDAQPAKKKKEVKPSEHERNKSVVANMTQGGTEVGRKVQGVLIEDLKIGTGAVSKNGDRIKMHYVGKLKSNGKVFDSSVNRPFVFRLGRGEVIAGWEIGCQGMAIGGRRRLTIPPEKAYGRAGAPPTIPGNATLIFEVSLVDIA